MPWRRPGKRDQQPRLGCGRDQPDPPRKTDQPPLALDAHQREHDLQCDHHDDGGRRLVSGFALLLVQVRRAHVAIVNHRRSAGSRRVPWTRPASAALRATTSQPTTTASLGRLRELLPSVPGHDIRIARRLVGCESLSVGIDRRQGGTMHRRISDHIRSNVVGYVALFIALGGTAYAVDGPLPGQNQVGSADIINNDVQSADIKDANLTTVDIRSNAVTTGKILDNDVRSADVLDNSLTGADVNEATLGKVPDADTLDGVDSSGFVRGSGSIQKVDFRANDGTGLTTILD